MTPRFALPISVSDKHHIWNDMLNTMIDETLEAEFALRQRHPERRSADRQGTKDVARGIEHGCRESRRRVLAFPCGDGVAVGLRLRDQAT